MLDISTHPNKLVLWTSVYAPQTSHTTSDTMAPEEGTGLQRSQSYSDISVSTGALFTAAFGIFLGFFERI